MDLDYATLQDQRNHDTWLCSCFMLLSSADQSNLCGIPLPPSSEFERTRGQSNEAECQVSLRLTNNIERAVKLF